MFSKITKFLLNTFTGNGKRLVSIDYALALHEANRAYLEEGKISFPEKAESYLRVSLQNGLNVTFHLEQSNKMEERLIGTMDVGDCIVSVCYHQDGKLDVFNNTPLLKALGRKEEDFTKLEELQYYYSVKEIIDFK